MKAKYFGTGAACRKVLKRISFCFLLAFISLNLGWSSAACEVTDELGRSINIGQIPERIVSLSPSNTEILFALGLEEKVVGVTDFCDYPPKAQLKQKIGGFFNPDIEKIIELCPDLVLAGSAHKNIIPKLERRGLSIVALAPQSLDHVLQDIKLVGKLTGAENEASRLVSDMKTRMNKVVNKTRNLPQTTKPRVFYITWHDPLWTVGRGALEDEMIQKAGGMNIAHSGSGHYVVDLEVVVDRSPEIIITSSGHGEALDLPYKWAVMEPRLKESEARRLCRIYQIDANLVSRPGPRIVDALEDLSHFIHPEIFPG
jgi:iron complex transport system substrate-binding protein